MPSVDITVERERAFQKATRHGILVRVLKFALPLSAIGVVMVALMVSQFSLMFGDNKVSVERIQVSSKNLTMVNPKLDGFTDEGGKYSVTAAEAIQAIGNQEEIKLNNVNAELLQVNKDWARITAPNGLFHVKREELDLSGDIRVTSSDGMKAFLTEAKIFVKNQQIISEQPVRVEMSQGTVRSDRMIIRSQDKIILFEGRVRVSLTMRPKDKTVGAKTNKMENQ